MFSRNKKTREIIINDRDIELENLYILDEKDVEEIGSILQKSPCWVAKRLETLKIVERKQLARGYIKYIESGEYKLKSKMYNLNRRENINKKASVRRFFVQHLGRYLNRLHLLI